MSELEDTQWSPACTHMATLDDNDERLASGAHTHGRPPVTSMHTHECGRGRLQPGGTGTRFFG